LAQEVSELTKCPQQKLVTFGERQFQVQGAVHEDTQHFPYPVVIFYLNIHCHLLDYIQANTVPENITGWIIGFL
jgi:hypothetical protein